MPPTARSIQYKPCMNPQEQSTIPGGQQFYLPEMINKGCSYDQDAGETYDPRYNSSGLSTNEYDV